MARPVGYGHAQSPVTIPVIGLCGHKDKLLEAARESRPIGDALVGNLTRTLETIAEPGTLIHGDAHAENLPLTE